MSLPSIRAMAVAQLLWELLNALNLPTGPQAPEIYLRLERQGSDKGCLSLSLTPEEEPVQLPERLLDGLLSEAQATLDVEETREARRILLRFPL